MTLHDRLQSVRRLFLDTAPVIYYVEENERYLPVVRTVFDRLDDNTLSAVTSPVTLAECLVVPYRLGQEQLGRSFTELVTNGSSTVFDLIDQAIADRAAELRARYNLNLTDAFQVAIALRAGCEAFLTNDLDLKRVTELDIIVLDEMES